MNESLIRCHLVASIIAADGRVEAQERDFLRAMMTQLGLDESERDQVEHFEGGEEALEAARQLPAAKRRQLLDDLVAASLSNSRISAFEMSLVKKLGELLGVD